MDNQKAFTNLILAFFFAVVVAPYNYITSDDHLIEVVSAILVLFGLQQRCDMLKLMWQYGGAKKDYLKRTLVILSIFFVTPFLWSNGKVAAIYLVFGGYWSLYVGKKVWDQEIEKEYQSLNK